MEERSLGTSDDLGLEMKVIAGPRRRSLDMAPLAWDRGKIEELARTADKWLLEQVRG